MKKKLIALILTFLMAASSVGCAGDNAAANPSTEPSQEVSPSLPPEPSPTVESLSPDEFVQAVKDAIDGDVGEGESILDVQLDGDELIVFVDISGANVPDGFTLSDIAKSRFSSITDDILELEGCDDLWEKITVDFGDVGYATGGKADVVDSIYGRYFGDNAVKILKK